MFTEPVSFLDNVLGETGFLMLFPAGIWWLGKGALEHVSAGKVARKQYASNARRSGPADRYAPL